MSASPTPLDRISGAAIVMEFEHVAIHDGDSFVVQFQSSAPLPTNAGEETAIGFTTPTAAQSTQRIHMTVDAMADDESTFEIREAPTVVLDQGTPVNALNRDRASNTVMLLLSQDTIQTAQVSTYNVAEANLANLAAAGAVLHTEVLAIGGAVPFGSVENTQLRGRREWILLPGTDYVIILTNLTANDTVHTITLNWYQLAPANYRR